MSTMMVESSRGMILPFDAGLVRTSGDDYNARRRGVPGSHDCSRLELGVQFSICLLAARCIQVRHLQTRRQRISL